MRATPHPWLLSLSMVALVPSMASAEFRYLAVGDVRQSYNSHVYDLDLAVDPTENHGLVTEIEPGIRLYAGQRRTLLSMRYSFLGQMIYILQQNEPVMGYGNRLQLNYTYRASPRTELGIMNLFEQGTENVTAPPTINEAGVPRAARMVTAGSVVTETLRVGVAHLVAPRWNIRPQLSVEVYQPYGDPPSDDIPTANPIYSLGLSFRVAWNWFQRSALVLDLSGSALFDNPDPAAFIPDQFDVNNNRISLQHERDGLPDYWRTLLGGAMLAWRWQLTDFLDAEIGGGVQYYTRQYFCDIRQNPACPPTFVDYEGGVAPLAEGFIRYRYGARLAVSLGYAHAWTRQTELVAAAIAEIDTAGMNVHYALKDWLFEGLGAFRYQRTETRGMEDAIDGALPDASKSLTGELLASYRLRRGLSIGLSYRVDGLLDRAPVLIPISDEQYRGEEPMPPNCAGNSNRRNCILNPKDVVRHVVTVGISIAWPPPPPQELRLTRRESQYEPVFFLGGGVGGGGGGGGVGATTALPNTRDRRRARPAWQGGVEMPEPVGPASIIPDEEPPPDRAEEQQQDDAYYSWPR